MVPLFLISLKAGGTGLNLTAADTVIHYDPWWNPAAVGKPGDRPRACIGQDKPVFVYKLIVPGSVRREVAALAKASKAALAARCSGEGTKPARRSRLKTLPLCSSVALTDPTFVRCAVASNTSGTGTSRSSDSIHHSV